MTNSFDGLQCALRIMLSCVLGYTASEQILLGTGPDAAVYLPPVQSVFNAAIAGMLTLTALWLAFGFRTRMAAMIGAALFAGKVLLLPGFGNATDDAIGNLILVAILALPLMLSGGGRYSLLRGGWQVQL